MKLGSWFKGSVLADCVIRRTPGLYAHYMGLVQRSERASLLERSALRERLTNRSVAWAAGTQFAVRKQLVGRYETWPLLTKETLRDESASMRRKTVLPKHFAETGGTTGVPVTVARTWQSVVFEQSVLDYLVRELGGIEWRRLRVAVLRGDTIKSPSDLTPPYWAYRKGGRFLAMSSNHLTAVTVDSYLDELRAFKPDMLWVYPTSLEALCRLAIGATCPIPDLKLILSSSEVLTPEIRALSSQFFGVRVLDYYGQAERVCLSWSLDGVKNFFIPSYGRVEFRHSYDLGEESFFEIIGTSYWNAAQPLIRYATGDLMRVPAGMSPSALDEIALGVRPFSGVVGRSSDYLVSPDGGHLMGIDHIPRGVKDVAQMQIHQYSRDRVRIYVVPLKGYSAATHQIIVRNARQKLPESMEVEVVAVDRIERTARGKAPLVVRDVSE